MAFLPTPVRPALQTAVRITAHGESLPLSRTVFGAIAELVKDGHTVEVLQPHPVDLARGLELVVRPSPSSRYGNGPTMLIRYFENPGRGFHAFTGVGSVWGDLDGVEVKSIRPFALHLSV